MNLDIEVKASLASIYGFPSHTSKERVLRSARVAKLSDWGKVIHVVSNGKIGNKTGEFLGRITYPGETQALWSGNR